MLDLLSPNPELFGGKRDSDRLYMALQSYAFDPPGSPPSFARKLARENCWTLNHADRVIDEYRRFVYLAVTAGHPVSPSDPVDQAWHQHLLQTHTYWEDFCPRVLGTALHHHPSGGGRGEQQTIKRWYAQTLESYRSVFGEQPPADIWPPLEVNFASVSRFVRLNADRHWLIPRPTWPLRPIRLAAIRFPSLRLAFGLGALSLMVAGCQSARQPNNSFPLSLNGPDFLLFYGLIAILAVILTGKLRERLRHTMIETPHDSDKLSAYETAYLDGKEVKVVQTALVKLIELGMVVLDPATQTPKVKSDQWQTLDPVEQAVVSGLRCSNSSVAAVLSSVAGEANLFVPIRQRLVDTGLVMRPRQAMLVSCCWLLVLGPVLALGVVRVQMGMALNHPTSFLQLLIFLLGLWGLMSSTPGHRTSQGEHSLSHLVQTVQRQTLLSTVPEQGPGLWTAYSVLGWAALPEVLAADFNTLLPPPPPPIAGGGGDGGGCGGGDGGGCGGGCGGCGGG